MKLSTKTIMALNNNAKFIILRIWKKSHISKKLLLLLVALGEQNAS